VLTADPDTPPIPGSPLAPDCPNQTAGTSLGGPEGVLYFPTIECGVLGVAVRRDERHR
jgi:hypothetical protein